MTFVLKRKNYLHIKKYNFKKCNQAQLNSTYNLLIKIIKIKTETLLSLKEIENYIFSYNIIRESTFLPLSLLKYYFSSFHILSF